MAERETYPKLTDDIDTDVVIIGGGLVGVLNAYRLSKAGKKVVLIEEKEIGSGATSVTTAFITKVIDSNLTEIISLFGKEAAKKVWESGQTAIEEYEKIITKEKIDCDFVRCPNYLYARTQSQLKDIEEEEKMYKKFGFKATLSKKNDLDFPNYGYLKIPDQAKFYATKFINGLIDKIGDDALIFENTQAKNIKEEGGIFIVETDKGSVTAKDVIIATYQPFTNKKTHLKKGMYMSYVFEVEIPKDSFLEAMYEDNGNPYYYFRIDPKGDRDQMIFGGEDHKDIFGKSLDKKSFSGLEKYLKKIMQNRPYAITSRWTGPILEPSDGLALIGEIKPHMYVAAAFSGNGMTYSMISSMLLTDLILRKKSKYTEVYDPKRALFHPKRLAVKAKDYTEEFFAGAIKNLLSS
jgi:glycine/D-amino acid oxidase-like deaminating enzyme